MRSIRITIAILFIAFVGVSDAGCQGTPDVSSLSWLAGSWSGVQDGLEMEEYWLAPKGNIMLGLHRDIKGGKTVSFEFLRIDSTPEGITYWASPRGRAATPFRLAETRENRVVFENREHDFPQRIIYWLDKDGALHAKIEGTMDGKAASEEWTWKKSDNK